MWQKLGNVFSVEDCKDWMVSHAAVPTVMPLDDGFLRVYFSTRDTRNRSTIGYFEMNPANPSTIRCVSTFPVLGPGRLGTFDDAGTMACSIVSLPSEVRMYYIGWNLGVTVPYRNSIGLAISYDGGLTFERYSEAPVLDRGNHSPCFVASPCVRVDGSKWRMWYCSCFAWDEVGGGFENRCDIKLAESTDGLSWTCDGRACISLSETEESVVVRPSILICDGLYTMWYAYRGSAFRIGVARSSDGRTWCRNDRSDACLSPSVTGWDAEQVAHPAVVECRGDRYMFYNGNGEGKTGIGLAIWNDDPQGGAPIEMG